MLIYFFYYCLKEAKYLTLYFFSMRPNCLDSYCEGKKVVFTGAASVMGEAKHTLVEQV